MPTMPNLKRLSSPRLSVRTTKDAHHEVASVSSNNNRKTAAATTTSGVATTLPSLFLDDSQYRTSESPRASSHTQRKAGWFSLKSPLSNTQSATSPTHPDASVSHGLRALPEHPGSNKKRWGRKKEKNAGKAVTNASAALQWPAHVDAHDRKLLWLEALGLNELPQQIYHDDDYESELANTAAESNTRNDHNPAVPSFEGMLGSKIKAEDHCLTPQGVRVIHSILTHLSANDGAVRGRGYALPSAARSYCPQVPDLLCCLLAFCSPADAERILVCILERSSASPMDHGVAGPSVYLTLSPASMTLSYSVLDDLIASSVPGAYSALRALDVRICQVAHCHQWFERLFFGILPYRAAVRVVDSLVGNINLVLYRIGIALVAVNQHEIVELCDKYGAQYGEFIAKNSSVILMHDMSGDGTATTTHDAPSSFMGRMKNTFGLTVDSNRKGNNQSNGSLVNDGSRHGGSPKGAAGVQRHNGVENEVFFLELCADLLKMWQNTSMEELFYYAFELDLNLEVVNGLAARKTLGMYAICSPSPVEFRTKSGRSSTSIPDVTKREEHGRGEHLNTKEHVQQLDGKEEQEDEQQQQQQHESEAEVNKNVESKTELKQDTESNLQPESTNDNTIHSMWNPYNYDWIGFDLDHTLIEYNQINTNKVMANAVLSHLEDKKRSGKLEESQLQNPNVVKSNILSSKNGVYAQDEYIMNQADRAVVQDVLGTLAPTEHVMKNMSKIGISVDGYRGNVVKLDYSNHVSLLFHGTRLATPVEMDLLASCADYGVESATKLSKINTQFEYLLIPLFATAVDGIDKMLWQESDKMLLQETETIKKNEQSKNNEPSKKNESKKNEKSKKKTGDHRQMKVNHWSGCPFNAARQTARCRALYQHCFVELKRAFVFAQSRLCGNGLEDALKLRISQMVKPRTHISKWLRALKAKTGCRLFVLSNATYAHSQLLMCYAYGHNWQDIFDVIVVGGRKSMFFDASNERSFSVVNTKVTAEGLSDRIQHREYIDAAQMKLGGVYSGGNADSLNQFLLSNPPEKRIAAYTGQTTEPVNSVMYFGDHLMHDVVYPRSVGWHTGAVLCDLGAFTKRLSQTSSQQQVMKRRESKRRMPKFSAFSGDNSHSSDNNSLSPHGRVSSSVSPVNRSHCNSIKNRPVHPIMTIRGLPRRAQEKRLDLKLNPKLNPKTGSQEIVSPLGVIVSPESETVRMPAVNGASPSNKADGVVSIAGISGIGIKTSETRLMKPVPPVKNSPHVLNPRNVNLPRKSSGTPPMLPSEWDEAAEYDVEGFMINTSSCHFKYMKKLSSLGNPLLCEATYSPSAFGAQLVTNASLCVASLENLAAADMHAWAEMMHHDGDMGLSGSGCSMLVNDMFAVRHAVLRPMADIDLFRDAHAFFFEKSGSGSS